MQAKHYLGAHPTDRHSRNAEVVLWLAIFGAAIAATTLFAALLAFCSPAAPPPIHAGGQNTGFAPNTHPKNKHGFLRVCTPHANVSAGATAGETASRTPSRPSSWGAAAPFILGEMATDAKDLSFARRSPVDHAGDRDRCLSLSGSEGHPTIGQTRKGSERAAGAQGEV